MNFVVLSMVGCMFYFYFRVDVDDFICYVEIEWIIGCSFVFVLVDYDLIGMMGFDDFIYDSVELGYWVGEFYWG